MPVRRRHRRARGLSRRQSVPEATPDTPAGPARAHGRRRPRVDRCPSTARAPDVRLRARRDDVRDRLDDRGERDVRAADDRGHRRLGLRGRPPARPVEREPPLHELARLGELRHELDLALARRRPDVQVGPGRGAAERQADRPATAAATPSSRSTRRAASTSTTSRSPTSASLAPTTSGAPSRAATPAFPTRPSTASGTRSTATRRPAARSTSTNDEVGNGNVQCGNTARTTSLVMYRSPVGRRRRHGGHRVRPAEPHHPAAARATRGSWATTRSARSRPRPALGGRDARAPGAARLRRPRRRQPEQDPDRALLPGRVRRADRERQRPERAELRRPPGRRPRRADTPSAPAANFPSLAIDRAGNLYAVWEQAPYDQAAQQAGDTALMYAYSTDEGSHWSAPVRIPTPGLANNVFAWAAAGDDGRVDIAWYGTAAHVDLANGGPDGVHGRRPRLGRRLLERLPDADAERRTRAPSTFTRAGRRRASTRSAAAASRRSSATSAAAPRTTSSRPTARSATSSSSGSAARARRRSRTPTPTSLLNALLGSHAMYVRQIGGTGVYAGQPPKGDAIQLNSTTRSGRRRDLRRARPTSANMPNLDITQLQGELAEQRLVPPGRRRPACAWR